MAAQAHSERVSARIRADIEAAGGWIPFARYMHLALHEPGLGYYAAGATKFGAGGDFVTAPEITPLFAAALATQIAAILKVTRSRDIVELGAGTGRLAADLLNALATQDALPSRYLIVETSPELRERQQKTLARDAAAHAAVVEWLDGLPNAIGGAVIANELLDAIPVHIVARRGDEWRERGVSVGVTPQGRGFVWQEHAADARLVSLARARFPAQDNYVSELNPAAEALVTTLARLIVEGALLLIDYGFPATEYYHLQRHGGTLMCHYRHRSYDDPFWFPGLTDITAHVDFSAAAEAGMQGGLDVAGFTSQEAFLLGCGILNRLAEVGPPESLPYIKSSGAVQKLLSPAEMGELFKVLALTRSPDIDWPGFALVDRSNRL